MNEEFVKSMPKLGFGMMRLPMAGDEIDLEQTCRMVDEFMAHGYTYFDTAYSYGDGANEIAVRKAVVERHPRDSFYLATKLSLFSKKTAEEARRMFDVSLERTGAGYFDFYLLHNLGDHRTALYEDLDLWRFILEKKAEGKIRHIGFSFHDTADKLDAILTQHPEAEFVQLQINYIDWENEKIQSRKCYEVARKHGKPVVIMEPVRGGNLATPPANVAELFRQENPEATPASWAIRFAASLPGVLTVLSGMSSIEQVRDNLQTMDHFKPLDAHEQQVICKAREMIEAIPTIPCTGCEYCLKGCPQQIAIPGAFAAYNTYQRFGNLQIVLGNYSWAREGFGRNRANECIECGLCETVCPQHIQIREELKRASALLDAPTA